MKLLSGHVNSITKLGPASSDVRVEKFGTVVKITLCRPKKLNSLSFSMIQDLKDAYSQLPANGARCLLLTGEGRALCAGGDVAAIREGVMLDNPKIGADFFFHEFQLDYEIARLWERRQVLQISILNGIVMGGGVGLTLTSPVRIATENTTFAMPETAIGYMPDVGVTWSLSRLKAGLPFGIFLGLTGQRIKAADCLYTGVATHYIPSAKLVELEKRLLQLEDPGNLDEVSRVITEIADGARPIEQSAIIIQNAAAIQRCFGHAPNIHVILSRLAAERTDWANQVLSTLRQVSPTSVKLSLEAILRHETTSLEQAFCNESGLQWH